MTYIDELAGAIRARVAPGLVPDVDTTALFRLYAVLARAKGEHVTASDVHDAWSAWMSGRDPGHPALRPFDELSTDVRAADQPYVEAIRAAARERRRPA
jgi:hypothetical protein